MLVKANVYEAQRFARLPPLIGNCPFMQNYCFVPCQGLTLRGSLHSVSRNIEIYSEYQTALDLLEEIHTRKLATIREEAEAARKSAEEAHPAELQRIEEEKKAREEALTSGLATVSSADSSAKDIVYNGGGR
jgi:hypothetical protein